jgi:hypothetical protein
MTLDTINWQKIGCYVSAIFVHAQSTFPGLNEAMVLDSIADGTFWFAFAKILISFFLVRLGVTTPPKERIVNLNQTVK